MGTLVFSCSSLPPKTEPLHVRGQGHEYFLKGGRVIELGFDETYWKCETGRIWRLREYWQDPELSEVFEVDDRTHPSDEIALIEAIKRQPHPRRMRIKWLNFKALEGATPESVDLARTLQGLFC